MTDTPIWSEQQIMILLDSMQFTLISMVCVPLGSIFQRDGEWGDNVEIQAMSEIYDRPIEIYAYSHSQYIE